MEEFQSVVPVVFVCVCWAKFNMDKLTEALEANKRANAIIGQQADELKKLSDDNDELRRQLESSRTSNVWLRGELARVGNPI